MQSLHGDLLRPSNYGTGTCEPLRRALFDLGILRITSLAINHRQARMNLRVLRLQICSGAQILDRGRIIFRLAALNPQN